MYLFLLDTETLNKTYLSNRTQSLCLTVTSNTTDNQNVVHNTINYKPMRSCSYSYGFDLTEKPTNTEVNVTSESRQPRSSVPSTSSVSVPLFNQRKHVVKELVKTQADFVLDMKNVLTAFDSVNLKVTESNRYSLLGNLDQLVHVSDAISMEFQKEISGYSDDRLGDACIAQCMSSFKSSINEALKTYILNFSVDASTKNPEIEAFSMLGFKNLQIERPNILTLNDELIKPVQRLVKLKQLFEYLKNVTPINHPDCLATVQMFSNFNELAYEVNEVKRWKEICVSVSDETRKLSLLHLVDKGTKRIIAKAARSSGSEATRKIHQKFLTEREAINHIEKSCVTLYNAVETRCKKTRYRFKCTFDFSSSNIKFYFKIIQAAFIETFTNCETCLLFRSSYCLSYFIRKMSSNVLNRLSELKKLINNLKRLLDKHDNAELNMILMDASIRNQNFKSPQAAVNVQLQREENTRNLATLQSGLQNSLPSLVKHANSILQSASQYAYILQSNLMQEAENLVQKCIKDYEQFNMYMQPSNYISPAEITTRIGKLKSLLQETRRCRTQRVYGVPDAFKYEESTLNEKYNTPSYESSLISDINHLSSSGFESQSSLTVSAGNIGKNSLSPYPTMKIIDCDSSDQQQQIQSRISSSSDISRRISVEEQPSTSKLCVNDNPISEPTHRITHDFSSKNKSVLILSKGQLVTVIRSYGFNGNTKWSLVKFYPCGEIKFVPTNYLETIENI
ncbi:hypothetical protein MN116_003797 [Schistosoma mekongi]|uniref:DH domain-containing protein n=1 Tax=Schistosoma mekongi TaxID=38744 RepID=A0AAE2D750_SCHME|nr:hypothetical protein MN116_003797 [Schistosoma mekongi]